jgi:hypothetical protein
LRSSHTRLRLARKRAAELADLPPEALQHLDASIEILANEKALRVACLAPLDASSEKWRQILLA